MGKVVGALCMVRNSVGSNAYVSDEIFTSRAGVRIRIGNTDAEGRMAMVDVLCRAKEMALNDTNPHLMTIATLTGHACLVMGPYSIIMDNGAAKADQTAQKMQKTGISIVTRAESLFPSFRLILHQALGPPDVIK